MRHSHSSHSSKSSGDNKSIASGSILSGEAEDFDVESVGEIINANSDVWMEEKVLCSCTYHTLTLTHRQNTH
ncbi:hypothetical protein SARC_11658 [Sphaeroforma arctica JP610]|uniref:Uncharacterized protein n=1 Tax=Sphaeroforma arctica JP610 TaxID=667725 RepID=A0A0L0FGB7_9EUKA|nr:hypothetical protein SARC_11658 [Sphaeroforma arctica JP610]KNC75824.1 hypothetical protein SARC_11658 [Sphaeroforma arctica JP610]|eukprot:XP_014149726.1 hypothetical protein SARC_11658 [Sphaeroforma arctica JP610]